jgi:hypothetical protein
MHTDRVDRRMSAVGSLGFGSATKGLDGEGGAVRRDGLDCRVVELLESACEVLAGQGRLSNLLGPRGDRAVDLNQDEVLSAVVGVARELIDAGCAGLGVTAPGESPRFFEAPARSGAPWVGPPPEVALLGARWLRRASPFDSGTGRGAWCRPAS